MYKLVSISWIYILLNVIVAQQCNNDYIISNNGQQLLTISATNKSCICSSFTGNGSTLTGLDLQPTIMTLQQEITNLNIQVVNLTTQIFKTINIYSEIRVNTPNGFNSNVRLFSNIEINTGEDISYNSYQGLFTINKQGIYSIYYSDRFSGSSDAGIVRNSVGSINFGGLSSNNILTAFSTSGTDITSSCAWTGTLVAGDIINAQVDTNTGQSTSHPGAIKFGIIKLDN